MRHPLNKLCLTGAVAAIVWFSGAVSAQAARFYFQPQESIIGVDDPFVVTIKLDADLPLNAVSVTALVPSDVHPQKFLTGESPISLWVEEPRWNPDDHTVTFAGIVPGGIHEQGLTLLAIEFAPLEASGTIAFSFDVSETVAYLHAPDGTQDTVRLDPIKIPVVAWKGNEPVGPEDTLAPEPFEPQIARSPDVFDNAWFAAFSTVDKGSGIDHYEVQEQIDSNPHTGGWEVAISPYRLRDQRRGSFVFMKAVDRNGNERVAVMPPATPRSWYQNPGVWMTGIAFAGMIGLGSLVVWVAWRFFRKKHL
jgi:hypothetical protein